MTYRGDASILDTIRLFAGAAAVVGYHGAGVTNSLFMPNQACVTEMSAYCDAEHRTVWRNCGECVTQWTPWLRWKLHKIPFRDMLEANGLAPTATVPADRDSWLKNLLYVGVLIAGLIGALSARFEPAGMERVLWATTAAQALVTGVTVTLISSDGPTLAMNGGFVLLWAAAAMLFRAARPAVARPAR